MFYKITAFLADLDVSVTEDVFQTRDFDPCDGLESGQFIERMCNVTLSR